MENKIFKYLMEIYPYPISISDFNGTYLFANDILAQNYGFSKGEDVVGLNHHDLNIIEYDSKGIAEKLSKGENIDNYEVSFKDKKENTWHFLFSSRLVKFNGSDAILSTTIDITKQKELELQLLKYQHELEALVKERTEELEATNEELRATNEELYEKGVIINSKNKELESTMKNLHETQMQLFQTEKMASLGTLTAGVSHEINNPLNFIMGAYTGFERYFNENKSLNEPLTTKLLDAMKLGIERTSSIVKGLNQFSRDSGNYSEDCDIPVIIDNCLVILQNKIKNKIEIFKKFQSDTILIKGNIGKLHQVFLNIFSNAIDAIPETGEIVIEVYAKNKNIEITITDNGEGIDKKFISQIADPFFTTKPPGKGTGLGLSITYTIISEHNGKISFESDKNKGTKVIITLPINHSVDGKES